MTVIARLSSQWVYRILLVGLLFFGFGVYGFYDGLYRYPEENRRVKMYQTDRMAWQLYAQEHGLDADKPGNLHSDGDIHTQIYLYGGVCVPLGLALLGWLAVSKTRSLQADEEGVTGTFGPKVPYGAIKSIDKSRWDSKGIAEVRYELEGKSGSVRLDDWKFKDAAGVLAAVESHLAGKPEPTPPNDRQGA